MRPDMKNINRKVLRGFCMGRMSEILQQEKKGWGMIKMELRCTFLKKLLKADIEKLILEISIGNRGKWSI